MKLTTTSIEEDNTITACFYCQLDTAGNHEWDCPYNIRLGEQGFNRIWGEKKMKGVKEFRKRFNKNMRKREKEQELRKKGWRIKGNPEYRTFRCSECQRIVRKAWHIQLRDREWRNVIHFCKRCGRKYGLRE